jgi:hypothetical protein
MSGKRKKRGRRREPVPRWLSVPLSAVALAVYWPLTKLFAKQWPRFAARAVNKFMMRFPKDYVPAAHDVFVCSYYKSGTNWTMQIAVQIAFRGQAEFEHIHDLVAWPDMGAQARLAVSLDDDGPRRAAPTGLRIIKTHVPLDALPFSPATRYLCVVRNPKDVFVSGYHFTRAMVLGPLMPTVPAWLDAYLSPDTPLGSWAHHVASGWRLRERGNVLFLTYESMRADLPATVDKIASFMGVVLEPAERTAVIERSTFEYMKAIGHKFDSPGAPWGKPAGSMMRRGKSGGSAELLSPEQQRRIDEYWRAELARLDCDFPYDEAFAPAAGSDARS